AVDHLHEGLDADSTHQGLGERIVEKCVGTLGCDRTRSGHGGRRRSDAGRQIPCVVVGSGHHAPCSVAVMYLTSAIALACSSSGIVNPLAAYSSGTPLAAMRQPCAVR